MQIAQRRSLVRVACVGTHCSPDDDLPLRMADEAEARWQAERAREREETQVRGRGEAGRGRTLAAATAVGCHCWRVLAAPS